MALIMRGAHRSPEHRILPPGIPPRALVAKGDDKGLIALKGGCNLRFFFGSVRYSEDMDLDVVVIAKETLKNQVDRLLKSP